MKILQVFSTQAKSRPILARFYAFIQRVYFGCNCSIVVMSCEAVYGVFLFCFFLVDSAWALITMLKNWQKSTHGYGTTCWLLLW